MTRWLPVLVCLWAATAQADPISAALDAVAALDEVKGALDSADQAEDRILALTETVKAYEHGLSALRETERRVRVSLDALQAEYAARSGEVSALLGALQVAGAPTTPTRILHPAGPVGSARAAMLLAEVVPSLQEQANSAAGDLRRIVALETAISSTAVALETGAHYARTARLSLVDALRSRDELPPPPADLAAQLNAAAGGLEDLALLLSETPEGRSVETGGGFRDRMGALALPVRGTLLAGRASDTPGIAIATRPRALITSPVQATIRFVGPVAGHGNVIILEPAPGYLLVMTGVHEPLVAPGEVLPPDAPLGLMGGTGYETAGSQNDHGQVLTETLYVETHAHGDLDDPANWFALDKER